ncbi:MAG: hypothetical protein WBL23_07440 [Salinisphaera sp.]|uniref:hypothetical protein n=1 Tax=Salinisphaera sp. TaxID=1914330 RepID=UPI003C7DCF65
MAEFQGRWRIVWMAEWDEDFIDLIAPGYFHFADDLGEFAFGAVTGAIDARYTEGGRRVDFSWEGHDEGDDVSGRGWLCLIDEETAEGRLFIHLGDDSAIRLKRQA